jgi:hypothetical protein
MKYFFFGSVVYAEISAVGTRLLDTVCNPENVEPLLTWMLCNPIGIGLEVSRGGAIISGGKV